MIRKQQQARPLSELLSCCFGFGSIRVPLTVSLFKHMERKKLNWALSGRGADSSNWMLLKYMFCTGFAFLRIETRLYIFDFITVRRDIKVSMMYYLCNKIYSFTKCIMNLALCVYVPVRITLHLSYCKYAYMYVLCMYVQSVRIW